MCLPFWLCWYFPTSFRNYFKRCLGRTVKMATVNHSDNLESCLENDGNTNNQQKNQQKSGRLEYKLQSMVSSAYIQCVLGT